MVNGVKDSFYLFFTVTARGIAQQLALIDVDSITYIFKDIVNLGATGIKQFIVAYSIHKDFLYARHNAAFYLCQWRLAYQPANNNGVRSCEIAFTFLGSRGEKDCYCCLSKSTSYLRITFIIKRLTIPDTYLIFVTYLQHNFVTI